MLSKISTNKQTNHMRNFTLFFVLSTLIFPSCIPVIKDTPAPDPTVTTATQWQPLPIINADQAIRAIHATPYEIYFLSNNQLFRVDLNRNLLEKRLLKTDRDFLGVPVMSDNSFARIIKGVSGNDATPFVEFQLARNASAVRAINPTSFLDASKNETFSIDKEPSRTPWCFSTDGTKFYLPGTVTPGFKPTVMIFDVNLNFQADNFATNNPIALRKRVEIPNLSTSQWESVRYIDGSLYLATKDGGFRVAADGTVKRLFTHWTYDFFKYGRIIYATGYQPSDFFSSSDDGITWRREGVSSLKFVETRGDKVFTQILRGERFNVADSTLQKVKEMQYNADFPNKPLTYNDIEFFRDNYYINVEKQVYSIKAIKTK
jgi:hypothetical protein